jgi:hypothetical protein
MAKLSELINDRRRRQDNPDRVRAIVHIFFDPVTKKESTCVKRQAFVIGGPRLQQEPEESHDAFKARVTAAVANQVKKQNGQIA